MGRWCNCSARSEDWNENKDKVNLFFTAGHSCHRVLLWGILCLCLSPPVPPPPRLFSLALTLISSLIYIVLVSDLQQRRRRYISFKLSDHPFKLYMNNDNNILILSTHPDMPTAGGIEKVSDFADDSNFKTSAQPGIGDISLVDRVEGEDSQGNYFLKPAPTKWILQWQR